MGFILLLVSRWWNLLGTLNFSMDQGMFMLRSREIWLGHEVTLLGPTASPIFEGKHFFQGPATYYLLGLMGFLGKWDPVKTTMIFGVLSLVGVAGMYLVFKKIEPRLAKFGTLVYGLWPVTVKYSRFLWNPNFLMITFPWAIWAFVEEKYLLAGALLGLSWQFHYQALVLIGLGLGYLLRRKKIREILLMLLGIGIGFSPLIVFDLRNHFYNTRIFLGWLTSGGGGTSVATEHYFLWLYFLVFVGGYYLATRYFKKVTLGLVIFTIVGLAVATGIEIKVTGNWVTVDYLSINEMESIILKSGCPTDFNVASTAEGDSRFYSLRYLLTKDNCKPMAVEDYPKAETLYLLAPKNRLVVQENIWEVKSLGKTKIINQQNLNSRLVFYKLKKDETGL